MDSSEDKCYMNKNSTVDCTKALVDEPACAEETVVGVQGCEGG